MTMFKRRSVIVGSIVGSLAAAFGGLGRVSAANPKPKPVRRVVTGRDANGKSVIVLDDMSSHVFQPPSQGVDITEIWKTVSSPADNTSAGDPVDGPLRLEPPANGSIFRILTFMPDAKRDANAGQHPEKEDGSGIMTALQKGAQARESGFHTTNTIDYVVVLSGEIYALMDVGEVLLKTGDVLVQRGTNHAWHNRSTAPASMAFVLVNAKPA
jgi:quercetin dioxygenase-like cupin family protein